MMAARLTRNPGSSQLSLATFEDRGSAGRFRTIGLYSLLITENLLAWTCAFVVFHSRPLLLGTALIAYGFGLRHAVDADHVAAIDNVIRKMMQQRQRAEDQRPTA
jgi:nickel/cobalt transporter (NiCoT) family protein